MTRETLLFLRDLLGRQQIQVGAPDFRETVAVVEQALRELDDAIGAAENGPAG